MEMSQRTPLYLGLITLSSALAAVTVVWAGLIGFGLSVLALEGLGRWLLR
ncbi:hypothetical protein [Reinekea sp.]|jgi:hypothetical protein|nr:hypothetical protein [Reinekea sp.]